MNVAQHMNAADASAVGGRTLEVFADTPRINRWIYSKIAPHVRGDVLEIGSGIGNLSGHIVGDAARVVLSDMESHYLQALTQRFAGDDRVTVSQYDLDGEPPPEIARRRFDAIVAVNVVEHIADDRALVRRLAALLKPGGKLLIYVPACPFAYGSLDRALGHHRRYTRATLAGLLAEAGLHFDPPRFMNLFGLLGWAVNGRLLRRTRLSPLQLGLFESLMPVFSLEDRIHLPIGLGVYVAAEKPAA
ncbi:MAG TPA: class I SAM-dependent methyltransferase [Polyangia bacterium]|jgi:SAM-dependent methyltransferase